MQNDRSGSFFVGDGLPAVRLSRLDVGKLKNLGVIVDGKVKPENSVGQLYPLDGENIVNGFSGIYNLGTGELDREFRVVGTYRERDRSGENQCADE